MGTSNQRLPAAGKGRGIVSALPIGDKFEWSRAKDFGALPNLKMLVLPEQFKAYHDDIMAAGGPVPVYSKAAPDQALRLAPNPAPEARTDGKKVHQFRQIRRPA